MLKPATIAALFFTATACVPPQARLTNLSPAYLYLAPSTSSFQDPEASVTGYHTFSIFPAAFLGATGATNEILEKQILFLLRNTLEAKGYRFVPLDQNPDFLATLTLASEYRETQVAPSTAVVPIWVPGRTVTSQSSTTGSFTYNTYGAYSSNGWGSYSGQTTTSTYVPGSVSTQTVVRPGYTVGRYYPVTNIAVVDGRTLKAVWIGTGAGTSGTADVRISGQLVVNAVVGRFPDAPATARPIASPGIVGVGLQVFTSDGNNYVPTVVSLLAKGPAAVAGLKQYDMILSIDGKPTVNRPFSETMRMLGGEPGTLAQIVVWRTGQQLNFLIPRALRR